MKVIFLDFDGVLNNYKFLSRERDLSPYNSELDPKNLKLLNDFLKDFDCKIIISSSWTDSLGINEIKSFFNDYKNILTRIIDVVDNTNYKKSEAIELSVKKHGLILKDIAIIDDDVLYPIGSLFGRRQIKTSMGTGITPQDLISLEDLLF